MPLTECVLGASETLPRKRPLLLPRQDARDFDTSETAVWEWVKQAERMQAAARRAA
jgi:hypothetical protein